MSTTLRILLLLAAVTAVIWILRKIRKSKVKMEDSIYWLFFAGVLLILGLFPGVSYKLSRMVGIMSPSNLVFLVVIILLIEKVFTLSILVSQLEDKVTVLSAELALRAHSAEKRLDMGEAGSEKREPGESDHEIIQ